MKRSLRALRSAARKPGTILTAIALLVAGTAFAVAVPLLRTPPPAQTTATVSGKLRAELDALGEAELTGRKVTVGSLTTEVSQTVANPDGTLTNTTYVVPVRVWQHGAWAPVSAALKRDASGAWQPAAVPSGVTLSGGGTGPLATMTSVTGQRLSLAFPARLPAPAVSGDTATYKSVWPGTDLQVAVSTLGGLTWTAIAHNAAAAANPALRDLSLGISGPGLTATSQGGSLLTTGPGSTAQFSGPPATIWDSRTSPASSVPRRDMGAPGKSTAMSPGRAARIALVPTRLTGQTLQLTPAASMLSRHASYPVYLSSSIAPDATMPPGDSQGSTTARQAGLKLSAMSSPTNCATVQNQNEACSGSNNGFVEVQQGCPTAANYDVEQGSGTSYPGNGIGYNWWDSCIGVFRSYYQFDTSGLISTLTSAPDYSTGTINMWVQSATLYAWVRYGADWGCTDTWPVSLDWSGPIDSGTDWNNKPGTDTSDQPRNFTTPSGPNPNSSCTAQTINFDVTYAITDAVNQMADNMTFRFDGDETDSSSSSNIGFMRIGDNPDIITVFDLNPPIPTNPETSPAAQYEPGGPARYGCGDSTGNLPWIDAVDNQETANSSGADISQFILHATISPGIPGEPVEARYKMWDSGTAISSSEVTGNDGASNWHTLSSGQTYTTNTPINFLLADGHQYTWTAQEFVSGMPQNTDPGYWSAKSAVCGFNVDMTPPTAPAVSSTVFPAPGSTNPGLAAGTTTGTFSFTSTDPAPSSCTSCNPSGVYEFAYSLNNVNALGSLENTTQVGCNSTSATATSGVIQASSGSATSCPVQPTLWGTNILYVAAVDKAGNVSTVTAYYFYVPWDPNKHPVPGDVDSDGIPDLLATSSGSDGLTLYKGNTDLKVSTSPASAGAESPDGSSWANYQITHRGPVSQLSASQNVDDLYAHKSGTANLYLYENDPVAPGTSPQFAKTNAIVPIQRPACGGSDCSGYQDNWSDVTQILSPGDAWNPTATADDTTDSGIPSLITVEDVNGTYELWAFQGNDAPGLQDPVELGSSGWGNITLAAPGYIDGRLTIWAYDNSSGALYSYPIYLVNGVPSLSSGSDTPIAAEQETSVFTYPYAHSGVAVASPGPLDMNTTPDGSSATNVNLPGLFVATPPVTTYSPILIEVTTSGTTQQDTSNDPNPSGATLIQGSVYDPNEVMSATCANGCLWYYPGEESGSGTYSLSTTPQFVGDLPAPVKQLSLDSLPAIRRGLANGPAAVRRRGRWPAWCRWWSRAMCDITLRTWVAGDGKGHWRSSDVAVRRNNSSRISARWCTDWTTYRRPDQSSRHSSISLIPAQSLPKRTTR